MKKRIHQTHILSPFILRMTKTLKADVPPPPGGSGGGTLGGSNQPVVAVLDGGISLLLSLATVFGLYKKSLLYFSLIVVILPLFFIRQL